MASERKLVCKVPLRVRYSETDQMGTFYNSRVLEWFEVARTELLRMIPCPPGRAGGYARMESLGVLLPLVEAHVEYLGPARYDDELEMTVRAEMPSRARVRFDVSITRADDASKPVAKGYTVHAVTDRDRRPIRPPEWFTDALTGRADAGCT